MHASVDELIRLSEREKLVFYSNLYNAMIIHANCVLLANEPIDPAVANDLRGQLLMMMVAMMMFATMMITMMMVVES